MFAILPVLTIMLITFSFFIPFCFSCTKYHKLVWSIYRKRNLVRMQYYSFVIFLFDYGDDVSDYKYLDVWLLRLWLRTEFTSLPFLLMLWQRTSFTFLTSPVKRAIGVRGLILCSKKFRVHSF